MFFSDMFEHFVLVNLLQFFAKGPIVLSFIYLSKMLLIIPCTLKKEKCINTKIINRNYSVQLKKLNHKCLQSRPINK